MIIAAGLSPAWQQILVFDEVAVGEVNRAQEAVWCASGKVLNVARAVWSLGADVAAVERSRRGTPMNSWGLAP